MNQENNQELIKWLLSSLDIQISKINEIAEIVNNDKTLDLAQDDCSNFLFDIINNIEKIPQKLDEKFKAEMRNQMIGLTTFGHRSQI